jgi:anti-sigma-K factor RskA
MTPEDLIGSGLLEAYALGRTTPEETALVEKARATHPSVRQELDALYASLEELAMKQAVVPPVHIRASVLKAIGHPEADRVRSLSPPPVNTGRSRWLVAASVVALAGSLGMNIQLYRTLANVKDQLALLVVERSVLAQEMEAQKVSLKGSQEQLAVLLDPSRKVIGMAGSALDPTGAARVYWDPVSHEVYLTVLSLPAPEPGKQYQLWALADGVPVDAGVFDVSSGPQHMKMITSAQTFAVTLERTGGVPSPTLSALYLMGQVG